MKRRLDYIDGLRGCACLIVFFQHFYLSFHHLFFGLNQLVTIPFFACIVNGNFAVCLFLIISSFVLGVSILKQDTPKYPTILLKRFPRLCIPVFFISVIIFILYKLGLFYHIQAADVLQIDFMKGYFTAPISFTQLLSSIIRILWIGDSSINGPFWMLPILFYGSFMTVILCLILKGIKKETAFLFLTSIIFLYLNNYYIAFVIGVFLAYQYVTFPNRTVRASLIILPALLLLAYANPIAAQVSTWHLPLEAFGRPMFYNMVSASLIVYAVLFSRRVQRLLSCQPFQFLGDLSFPIYLLHWPLICSFSCWAFLGMYSVEGSIPFSIAAVFVLTCALLIFASYFFHTKLEPFANRITALLVAYFIKEERPSAPAVIADQEHIPSIEMKQK